MQSFMQTEFSVSGRGMSSLFIKEGKENGEWKRARIRGNEIAVIREVTDVSFSAGTGGQGTASFVQVKGGSFAQLSDASRRLVLGITWRRFTTNLKIFSQGQQQVALFFRRNAEKEGEVMIEINKTQWSLWEKRNL